MTSPSSEAAAHSAADASTVTLFQRDWEIYRKMVENNFLFHREAYGRLHRLLVEEIAKPFRFLDIACGDASASAGALRDTHVASYRGIDFSAAALEIAAESLDGIGCPVVLEKRDFLEALDGRTDLADVVWLGLSLHHLQGPGKAAFMREVRGVLASGGVFIVYENTSPDGEDRQSWLQRWDQQRTAWSAYSEAEWNAMRDHVHAADFPETVSGWHALGRDAGFASVRELFVAPSDLFRMYCFAT